MSSDANEIRQLLVQQMEAAIKNKKRGKIKIAVTERPNNSFRCNKTARDASALPNIHHWPPNRVWLYSQGSHTPPRKTHRHTHTHTHTTEKMKDVNQLVSVCLPLHSQTNNALHWTYRRFPFSDTKACITDHKTNESHQELKVEIFRIQQGPE